MQIASPVAEAAGAKASTRSAIVVLGAPSARSPRSAGGLSRRHTSAQSASMPAGGGATHQHIRVPARSLRLARCSGIAGQNPTNNTSRAGLKRTARMGAAPARCLGGQLESMLGACCSANSAHRGNKDRFSSQSSSAVHTCAAKASVPARACRYPQSELSQARCFIGNRCPLLGCGTRDKVTSPVARIPQDLRSTVKRARTRAGATSASTRASGQLCRS